MSLWSLPQGTRVRLRYKGGRSWLFPFHDCVGIVVVPPWGPGKRNHMVRIVGGEFDGLRVNVPAGHLKPVVEKRGGK